MSAIAPNNRQAPVSLTIPADPGDEVDILQAVAVPDAYASANGMSTNGGGVLSLEVDASQATTDIVLKAYRRATSTSAWSMSFWTATVTATTVFTDRITGLGGFNAVRIVAVRVDDAQIVSVSAAIWPI